MKSPILTVITPVYNGERFIESCLQSVLRQGCQDVEHLIIDGGSTDKTLEIIKRYAEHCRHLKWISEKDPGQSAAMNKGIALARARVIGFLNCDDYYGPGTLHRVVDIIQTLPDPSLLVGNCNVLNEDEVVTYHNKPSRLSLTNILIGGEKNQFPFNPSSYFYHKSLHERIGPYDESDHYTMDIEFLLRAVRAAHVHYVNETWGNFRFIRGTKTFRLKENGQLEPNKMRVMNACMEKLPKTQRWWIKMIQFLFIQHKPRYYAGRIMDCIRDPKEINSILVKKFKHHLASHERKRFVNTAITH